MGNISHKSSNLPPDLVYDIIDQCRDNIRTLKTCTLVSRTWLGAARSHIFSTITVVPADSERCCDSFLRLLELDPSVCPCILRLNVGRQNAGPESYGDVHLPDLWAVISRLVRLQTLFLSIVHILPWPLNTPLPLSPAPSIKLLWLSRTAVIETSRVWHPLSELLSMFSSIETLFLESAFLLTTIHGQDLPPSLVLPRIPRVNTLDFSPSHVHPGPHTGLADHLVNFIDMEKLVSLHFKDSENGGPERNRQHRVLINAATQLKSLELWFPVYCADTSLVPHVISLSSCNTLETIELVFELGALFTPNDLSDFNLRWSHVITVLSSLPSSSLLHTIQFSLSYTLLIEDDSRILNLNLVDWAKLGHVLEHLEEVKKVDVRIVPDVWGSTSHRLDKLTAMVEFFKQGLAGISQRYAVQVSSTV